MAALREKCCLGAHCLETDNAYLCKPTKEEPGMECVGQRLGHSGLLWEAEGDG